ncbi:MAG: methyltransferase domain-containing protein [Gammaproteobacteria bacterium]
MSSVRRTTLPDSAFQRLREWYLLPLGRLLGTAEAQALDELLPMLFGYHLLAVDPPWQDDVLCASRIPHHVVMRRESTAPAGLWGAADAMPMATDSLDMLILPHILELADDPHQVLREAERCLIPEGHVIIIGFNPFSCWGVRRLLMGWYGQLPWCARFISVTRAKDWLALLGFDALAVRHVFFRPPLKNHGSLQRLAFLDRLGRRGWLPGAAAYLLLARKRVAGMTPVRPRWRPRRRFVAAGIAGPTHRGYGRGG